MSDNDLNELPDSKTNETQFSNLLNSIKEELNQTDSDETNQSQTKFTLIENESQNIQSLNEEINFSNQIEKNINQEKEQEIKNSEKFIGENEPSNSNQKPFKEDKNNQDEINKNENTKMQKTKNKIVEPEQFRKVFIGGLSYKTDDENLKNYFEKYGELVDYVVMKDQNSGRSRGFGFVTYSESFMVDELMKYRPHMVDGRQIEPKRATPREESGKSQVQMSATKLFVGGLKDKIFEEDLKSYFSNYGTIIDTVVMKEKETSKSRGFGFVTFDDYDPVDKIILQKSHVINDINVHIEKAMPKDSEKVQSNHQNRNFRMKNGSNYNNDNNHYNNGNINNRNKSRRNNNNYSNDNFNSNDFNDELDPINDYNNSTYSNLNSLEIDQRMEINNQFDNFSAMLTDIYSNFNQNMSNNINNSNNNNFGIDPNFFNNMASKIMENFGTAPGSGPIRSNERFMNRYMGPYSNGPYNEFDGNNLNNVSHNYNRNRSGRIDRGRGGAGRNKFLNRNKN